MPTYDYSCDDCKKDFEITVVSYRDHTDLYPCPTCARAAHYVMKGCSIQPDTFWSGHYDEALGVHVNSKSELKVLEKERGIHEYDPGCARDARHAREDKRAKADKAREHIVRSTLRDILI